MVVFGITGGSGSGKTSVSKMLEKLGVHIIDTDVIAHRIRRTKRVVLRIGRLFR